MAKNIEKTKENKEVEELRKQVDELLQTISLIKTGQSLGSVIQSGMSNDRDVIFMSLYPGILYLSTEARGEGNVYKFENYGEEIAIPYSDAKAILRHNRSFIEDGKCNILDEEFIENEKIKTICKNIVSFETLNEMLSLDYEDFEEAFKAMRDSQKKTFTSMVFKKVYEDKRSVDMNIIQIINEVLNRDIMTEVNSIKFIKKNNEK